METGSVEPTGSFSPSQRQATSDRCLRLWHKLYNLNRKRILKDEVTDLRRRIKKECSSRQTNVKVHYVDVRCVQNRRECEHLKALKSLLKKLL